MTDKTAAELEARISNLEVALQAMWVLMREYQPLGVRENVENLMVSHFEASESLGGCRRLGMIYRVQEGGSDE